MQPAVAGPALEHQADVGCTVYSLLSGYERRPGTRKRVAELTEEPNRAVGNRKDPELVVVAAGEAARCGAYIVKIVRHQRADFRRPHPVDLLGRPDRPAHHAAVKRLFLEARQQAPLDRMVRQRADIPANPLGFGPVGFPFASVRRMADVIPRAGELRACTLEARDPESDPPVALAGRSVRVHYHGVQTETAYDGLGGRPPGNPIVRFRQTKHAALVATPAFGLGAPPHLIAVRRAQGRSAHLGSRRRSRRIRHGQQFGMQFRPLLKEYQFTLRRNYFRQGLEEQVHVSASEISRHFPYEFVPTATVGLSDDPIVSPGSGKDISVLVSTHLPAVLQEDWGSRFRPKVRSRPGSSTAPAESKVAATPVLTRTTGLFGRTAQCPVIRMRKYLAHVRNMRYAHRTGPRWPRE